MMKKSRLNLENLIYVKRKKIQYLFRQKTARIIKDVYQLIYVFFIE